MTQNHKLMCINIAENKATWCCFPAYELFITFDSENYYSKSKVEKIV